MKGKYESVVQQQALDNTTSVIIADKNVHQFLGCLLATFALKVNQWQLQSFQKIYATLMLARGACALSIHLVLTIWLCMCLAVLGEPKTVITKNLIQRQTSRV